MQLSREFLLPAPTALLLLMGPEEEGRDLRGGVVLRVGR